MDDRGTLPEAWREAALGRLVDENADGIWICDRELRCLYWNRAMELLSGLHAPNVLGYGILEVLSRVTGSDQSPAIRQTIGGQPPEPALVLVRPDDGPARSLEVRYLLLRSRSEAIVGVAAVIRDATEETKIRQELQETDARFRNMADVAPVLLWMSGTDGLCNFFNQTWLEFTGRSLEEERGVGWAENVHFEDLESCLDTYVESFNNRRLFEMEYRLRRHDGEFRWILDRGIPRYSPDGRFVGYIGSCIDISDRRRMESELRAAIDARDDFLSVASHELRTPLTSVRLQVDTVRRVLARSGEGPMETALLATRMTSLERELARMEELVDTLLDTTRLAIGELKLELERLELGALVERVVQGLGGVAAEARCAVTIDRGSGPLHGTWNRHRLEQALMNLLSNAFKYAAGAPVEVDVGATAGTASIRVRDHGMGLPESQQTLIFERFGRGPRAQNFGGLGLGLWIARQSVQAMGGTIRVHSRPGEGATFEIALPCEPGV